MKAMISQPMNGFSDDQIISARNKALAVLEKAGYEVVNTFFTDGYYNKKVKNKPLLYLAKSLENMAECDLAYFVKGWSKARGCLVEYLAANLYGVQCKFEDLHDLEEMEKNNEQH